MTGSPSPSPIGSPTMRLGHALAAGLGALAFVLAIGAAAAQARELAHWSRGAAAPSRGAALFDRALGLDGRLAGSTEQLPQQALRCINCHTRHGASASTIGSTLSPGVLLTPMRRRGGPPSSYDAGALCRVLRSGADPGGIVVRREMPRFPHITADDCRALWSYLMQAQPGDAKLQ